MYSHNVSLDLVDKSFGTIPAPNPRPAKITFGNGTEPSDTNAQLLDYGVSKVPTASSPDNQPAPAADQPTNPIWEYEAIPPSHEELGNYVSRCLLYLLSTCAHVQVSI